MVTRLARFLETAGSVLNYFEPFLGRIEIMGGSKRIEGVYFEIKQWEKPQIKNQNVHSSRARRAFVCEDAIFEMTQVSGLMAASEESVGGLKNREFYHVYMGDDEEER